MDSLIFFQEMSAIFNHRSLHGHECEDRVVTCPHGDILAHIITDPSLSKFILNHPSFLTHNMYAQGWEHMQSKGCPVSKIQDYFSGLGIFNDDRDAHLPVKKDMISRLAGESEFLLGIETDISKTLHRRSFDSVLSFCQSAVRLCLGVSMSRLGGVNILSAMRALRNRENVFGLAFNPAHHRRCNKTLQDLGSDDPLTCSMVVMGYEPLVTTLCASLVEGVEPDARRYCPVSMVVRRCNEDCSVDGVEFHAGDICALSLMGREDRDTPNIPYGYGAHACSGKNYSKTVLDILYRIGQEIDLPNNVFPVVKGAGITFQTTESP